MKITAAVVPVRSAPFEIETLDLAAPLTDEVLVRVVASGMCHTDLHARDGYFPNLPYPVVCGHEGAGIVEQVGALMAARIAGCDPIIAVDRLPGRLALARELGATHRKPRRRDARRNPQDHRWRHRFRTGDVSRAVRVSACRRRAARSWHLRPSRQRRGGHGGQF
jgi:Zn-dependent alcohol dehydrogenase